MFQLLNSIRANTVETPDTGTFADGLYHMPRIELRSTDAKDRGRSAHVRDYGSDRTVAPAAIGFA